MVALACVYLWAPAPPASAGDAVVTVRIRDNVFEPPSLRITPGTTVRWVNEGRNRHDVTPNRTPPSEKDAFGSPQATRPGQSYAHTFEDAGSFAYYCTIHGAPGEGQHADLSVGKDVAAAPAVPVGGGDAPAPSFTASGRTIRVPGDAPHDPAGRRPHASRRPRARVARHRTARASPSRPTGSCCAASIGTARSSTASSQRENGVKVVGADGVAIENLTARNYTENGFFWTGVLGYRGSYLTAYRNGDYGIYAFDSQWGQLDHSYASGSPDAGFYIGQCDPCHALITDVVAEHNQLGYSGTELERRPLHRAVVVEHNRAGIVPEQPRRRAPATPGRRGHRRELGHRQRECRRGDRHRGVRRALRGRDRDHRGRG